MHGICGVMMVMVVGFLTGAVPLSVLIGFWYDDITELLVIEVVDVDLCQILGLWADGPAKPISLDKYLSSCINSILSLFFTQQFTYKSCDGR